MASFKCSTEGQGTGSETYNSLKKKKIKSATPLLLKQAAKYFLEELLLENSANGIEEKKIKFGSPTAHFGYEPAMI